MTNSGPNSRRKRYLLLLDLLLVFLCTAVLVRPLFKAKYLQAWASIESTFIADARFLAAHWPHPGWQPLWYAGTRFDYVYPPVLRYGTALFTNLFIPVRAYHFFIAFMFCLGIAGVYFMVRIMGASRSRGWLCAAGCALISPSFLFVTDVRHDAPFLMPLRLGVLIRYGEGPHISSLSLLPFALAFAFLGLRRGRYGALACAAIFSALVVLTNFYGATALAIFYPILVWSVWVAQKGTRDRAIWLRAVAIPILAYALTAFWLTPAYLRITLYNLRYVSQPGNSYSWALLLIVALLFGVASLRFADRSSGPAAYPVFVAGSLAFFSLNVLGHYYFNFRIIGEPHRLEPELDMTMILAAVQVLAWLWNHNFATRPLQRTARVFAVLLALASLWPERHFIRRAWDFYPLENDYRTRVEYRLSTWLATNLPNARTMVTGSTRFWWDAWNDNAEMGGGSDQGLMNPNPSAALWELVVGQNPEPSVHWLQSLAVDAVVVSDSHSQDEYRDFHLPYKFAGVLPVLYDDHAGDVIYGVPRRYPSLARVLDRSQIVTVPIAPAFNPEAVRQYSNSVEHGPESPTATHWEGTDSLVIHAPVGAAQSVLAQITYDPAWRAYSGKTELPIRPDAMDFMLIDAPAGTQDIVLKFTTPIGNRIGYIITSLALLGCIWLGIAGRNTETLPEPESPPQPPSPFLLRTLRALLRRIYRSAPDVPPESDLSHFNASRLAAAEAALRALKMPDADGDRYLAKHIPRLAKTLALVPPPQAASRVLELGCYMQITPLLERLSGYKEVRGAYYGQPGQIDRKTYNFPDGQFACYVDHFDVERHSFPYPDDYFDLVVAGEIIEHMTHDPMWMLLESRRVLAEGGYLLLSTPNVGSVTSVAKTLDGRDNPQIFFLYERPGPDGRTDIGHVREYTMHEMGEAVKAAGFEIELLFTTYIDEFAEHKQMLKFLALNGFNTENRGEQTWCLARKRGALPVDRYPWFMYNP